MILKQLTALSNKYGSDEELVLAGGGNSSAKEGNVLYIKGSGTSLATVKAGDFVKIDIEKLLSVFEKKYPEDDKLREAMALEDLMAARLPSDIDKRPSVETTLHGIFPQTFVLHVHPAVVNGLTCGADGEKIAKELFGEEIIWVGLCRPGYVLAKLCKELMEDYKKRFSVNASIILLQNHGIFVAANDVEGLSQVLEGVLRKIRGRLTRYPAPHKKQAPENCGEYCRTLCALYGNGASAVYENFEESLRFSASKQSAEPLLRPFTPDHIVYCRAYPLFIDSIAQAEWGFEQYKSEHGFPPKIVIVRGMGYFAFGENESAAKTAHILFKDAIKIAVYAQSFGGVLHMTDELINFIVNWEVESYRQKQSNKAE
ncbi:MAG: class II aldolase [Clostridiales bacterium]|nr:class II aldolase [Clostridiales bacterium]